MSTVTEILEGTDVPQKNFQIKIGGVAQLLANLEDYGVNICSMENGEKSILFKFRKTADLTNGVKAIITVASDKGGFIVDRNQTKSLKVKKAGLDLFVEVFYKIAAANYESNFKVSGKGNYILCKVVKSSTPSDFT